MTSHLGRNVAKLASRSTANIAVARRDVAIVVYGSVKMGRLRRVVFGAALGLWDGDSDRKRKYGTELATIEESVVTTSEDGWMS